MVDEAIGELAPVIGTRAACAALGKSRATYYRQHRQSPPAPRPPREGAGQPRALSVAERAEVLGVLHADRFVDQAPASIYATLLDDGRYLCSVPTMYRLLRAEDEVRERRRQATHPARIKPELVASGPNTVWSWDITKLLGPEKWTYYHLYVVIDIYSRYVTGWLLAGRETAELAERLLGETIRKQHVAADQLTIHADRGTSMASKTVALLLADLGVTKSHCDNEVTGDGRHDSKLPLALGSHRDALHENCLPTTTALTWNTLSLA
jgi:putative transposase